MGAVNLYICYTLHRYPRELDTDFTLANCLFGSAKLTKNANPDKYKYGGYGIGFNSCWQFSFKDGKMGNISFFLELIWAHMCILTIIEKTS